MVGSEEYGAFHWDWMHRQYPRLKVIQVLLVAPIVLVYLEEEQERRTYAVEKCVNYSNL